MCRERGGVHGRISEHAKVEGSGGHRARLRKRLLEAGAEGFHDYELVEYLLALTIPRVDTKPLAKRLLHDFGGIGPLLTASWETLKRRTVRAGVGGAGVIPTMARNFRR